jgi:hypothetical protein
MTPRASDIYFQLLDARMEKLSSAIPKGLTSRFADWWMHALGGTAPRVVEDVAKAAPKAEAAAAQAAASQAAAQLAPRNGYGLGTVLGATGLGAIGAGMLGSAMAEQEAAEQAKKDRLKYLATGFGGGVATGLAAPSIMGGVNSLIGKLNLAVGNQGFMPSDAYAEQDYTPSSPYGSSLGYYPEQEYTQSSPYGSSLGYYPEQY